MKTPLHPLVSHAGIFFHQMYRRGLCDCDCTVTNDYAVKLSECKFADGVDLHLHRLLSGTISPCSSVFLCPAIACNAVIVQHCINMINCIDIYKR